MSGIVDLLGDIGDAIRVKNGTTDLIPALNIPSKILEIGGDTPTAWQPRPDWYDIKQVFADDVQTGHTKRYIYLVSDSNNTITLSGGTAYKTSDGAFYTSNTTHTWNRALDKPCSDGYKTRWVIAYHTGDVAVNHGSIDSLWVYFGDCNISGLYFGGNPYNRIIQSIEVSEATTANSGAIGNNAFQDCYALTNINIPNGVISIGNSAFL